MNDQEWLKLTARVPVGTRVKANVEMTLVREFGNLNIGQLEGVVIRHGFEFERTHRKHKPGTTWINILIVQFFDDANEWDVSPKYLLYFIASEWVTFDTLTGEA